MCFPHHSWSVFVVCAVDVKGKRSASSKVWLTSQRTLESWESRQTFDQHREKGSCALTQDNTSSSAGCKLVMWSRHLYPKYERVFSSFQPIRALESYSDSNTVCSSWVESVKNNNTWPKLFFRTFLIVHKNRLEYLV